MILFWSKRGTGLYSYRGACLGLAKKRHRTACTPVIVETRQSEMLWSKRGTLYSCYRGARQSEMVWPKRGTVLHTPLLSWRPVSHKCFGQKGLLHPFAVRVYSASPPRTQPVFSLRSGPGAAECLRGSQVVPSREGPGLPHVKGLRLLRVHQPCGHGYRLRGPARNDPGG